MACLNQMPKDGVLGEAQLIRDRRTERVMYMTVSKEIANLLLAALSLPASILSELFAGAGYLAPLGAVSNIFRSMKQWGQETVEAQPPPEEDSKKRKLSSDDLAWHVHIYKQLLAHQHQAMKWMGAKHYKCVNNSRRQNCSILVTEVKGKQCSQCDQPMTEEVIPNHGMANITDVSQVAFSETMRIMPLTTVDTLVEVMVKEEDLGILPHVETCNTSVGIKEVLQLAHASFTSTTPLTHVFGCASPSHPS